MKTTSGITKLILLLFFGGVLLYFGVQAYRYMTNPLTTTVAYQYTVEDTLTLQGYVVREETVLPSSGGLLHLDCGEGERVGKGQSVATVYTSADALSREEELADLRSELALLEYAQSTALSPEMAVRMDSEINTELLSMRADLSTQDFDAAAESASALKDLIRKRNFACGDASEVSARIQEVNEQIRSLSSANKGNVHHITADFSATFSSVVDGYEDVLTPESLESMTVESFRAISRGTASSDVGKLISGSRWYYVTLVPADEAAKMTAGRSETLRFSRGMNVDVSMKVERIGKETDGVCLAVFSADRYLSLATLLREQSAELIRASYTGLRVPENALRVQTETVTDEKGGTQETKTTGVYCMVGLVSYFKPVEVLYHGEDYYIVSPLKIDSTSESKILLYTIRSGDEVIVSANELYDGKVVG